MVFSNIFKKMVKNAKWWSKIKYNLSPVPGCKKKVPFLKGFKKTHKVYISKAVLEKYSFLKGSPSRCLDFDSSI